MNKYDKIIKDNIGFIKKIANKYCYNNDMFEDYFQEACLQTIKIYNKFDKSKGNKFITYLYVSLPRRMAGIKRTRKLDSLVYLPDRVGKEVGNDKNAYSVSLTDDYLFIDFIKADDNTPDKILEDKVTFMNEINEYKFLSDTDKEVIRYYYGINLDRPYNQSEIATLFNYKSCYVIHNKIKRALDKIRKHLGVETNGKKNKEN